MRSLSLPGGEVNHKNHTTVGRLKTELKRNGKPTTPTSDLRLELFAACFFFVLFFSYFFSSPNDIILSAVRDEGHAGKKRQAKHKLTSDVTHFVKLNPS